MSGRLKPAPPILGPERAVPARPTAPRRERLHTRLTSPGSAGRRRRSPPALAAAALAVALSLCAASAAAGEVIPVPPEQMERLGIATARPEAVETWQSTAVPATVVIPPTADHAVSATLGGLVTNLKAAFGERVAKGEVVAVLESPAFLELQRDFLKSLTKVNLAAVELERDRRMAAEEIIPERRLQSAESRHEELSAELAERRQALRLAGLSGGEIDRLADARALKPALEVRAPISGVVVERMARAGQQVERATPLYRIADLSTLWLEIRCPCGRVPEAQVGAAVTVEGLPARGRIIAIGPVVERESQSVLVRVEVTEGTDHLRPGQFVQVRVANGREGSAFRVPADAVVRRGDKAFVFVRAAGGFRPVAVELGAGTGGGVIVTGGLSGGEEVAVEGAAVIKGRWMGLGGGG